MSNKKRQVKKCVLEIIDAFCDRSGFDDWWYNLDDDIEKEIEKELEDIIERRLKQLSEECKCVTPSFIKEENSYGEVIDYCVNCKKPKQR